MLDTFHATPHQIRHEQAIGAGAIFQQGIAHPHFCTTSS